MSRAIKTLAVVALILAFQPGHAEAKLHHSHLATADVLAMQDRLERLGLYTGPTDGIMGPLTHAALASFQHEHNMFVSGEPTWETRAVLGSLLPYGNGMYAYPNAQPVAYFANPWQTRPQYIVRSIAYERPMVQIVPMASYPMYYNGYGR